MSILGLDIGGSSLKLGAWRADGRRLGERIGWRDGIPVPTQSDPDEVCREIAARVGDFAAELDDAPTALGVGSAGLISDGVILQSPNTPWDHLPLQPALTELLGYQVRVINDADAFLLGALSAGHALPRCALGLTLGTGIGTAVWLDGRLLAGGSGISPEAGHITLDLYGDEANTGIPGSWEQLAGLSALLRYYEERGGEALTEARQVAEAARAEPEDGTARSAWRRYGHCVGAGLGSLTNLFSPELVIIGGGLAGARELFHDSLTFALLKHKLQAMPVPQLRYVEEEPDMVARGGAYAALLS